MASPPTTNPVAVEDPLVPSYASSDTAPVTKTETLDKTETTSVDGTGNATLGYGQSNAPLTKEERLAAEKAQRESLILSGMKLALVFAGMLMSVFLIALDQTILAPALPVIASKFNALDNIAWIASAYFLTQTASLLLYGQALMFFDRKWTFLSAIVIFEIGSLICAVAPNVDVLIFGRAFAGLGAGGIFTSCLGIIADVTRLEDRPKLLGLFGAVFAVSSIIGPLLGGAFTDKVTWRLCFYINLPFGAITVLAILFILGPTPPPPMGEEVAEYTERKLARYSFGKLKLARSSFLFRFLGLDWIGSTLMLATITSLLLPLQWGGNTYAWSSPTVIGVFCCFAVLVVLFVVYEWKFAGQSSILPLRFFRNRTQIGACLEAFFLMFVMLVGIYYLPIYFQAARLQTSIKSGISILPFMLSVVVAAGVGGGLISALGRYWHFLFFAPILLCIGGGLIYTWQVVEPWSKLIGYQIIMGAGVGMVMQNTIIAIQADIEDEKDVAQATALVTFTQLVGGTIGIAIASTVFGSKLASGLHTLAPEVDFELLRNSVDAIKNLTGASQANVQKAYVDALQQVFIIAVPGGALSMLSALLIRNVSIKGRDMMAGGAA